MHVQVIVVTYIDMPDMYVCRVVDQRAYILGMPMLQLI